MVFVLLLFQAEHGIRHLSVTGVQTCALPISIRAPLDARAVTFGSRGARQARARPIAADRARFMRDDRSRSEERRVGKECRSRWLAGYCEGRTYDLNIGRFVEILDNFIYIRTR